VTNPTTGPFAGYRVTQPGNAGSGYVQGVEIGFQQRLSYLPGVLSGAGVSANYSYTSSTARGLPNRTDQPTLLRQAPNTWNFSPTYDTKKFSMRLGMSYNDKMLYQYQWETGADSIGPNGPVGDIYLYSHVQLDTEASYKLPFGFQVYVSGLNLNNEVFGFYNGSPQYVLQREYYHPTYAGGLRWTSTKEK
jgi:outer membrane receptor protein involved in Fe transport